MQRCVVDNPELASRKNEVVEECEEVIEEIDNGGGAEELIIIKQSALDIRKNLYYINKFGDWNLNKVPFRSSLRLSNKIVEICDEGIKEEAERIEQKNTEEKYKSFETSTLNRNLPL